MATRERTASSSSGIEQRDGEQPDPHAVSNTRWENRGEPTDTGVPIDAEYCQAHDAERTVSVGYDPEEADRTRRALERGEAFESGEQPLSAEGSDGSGSSKDAWTDGKEREHTVAGERTAVVGSTFYADPSMNRETWIRGDWSESKWNRLFLYHSGKDVHKSGNGSNVNPRHKENASAKFNHDKAEVLCDAAELTPKQKHAVLTAVDGTSFNRYTYLCEVADGVGAVEVVTVGIIACVLAYWIDDPLDSEGVLKAADVAAIHDIEYVAAEVAAKKDFPWMVED